LIIAVRKGCYADRNPVDEIAEVFLDEVPDMLEAFGNDAKRSHLQPSTTEHGISPHNPAQFTFKQGETDMGDKGKKDKGKTTEKGPA
jgi:hypothetical protein